jgi:hypothetical protein
MYVSIAIIAWNEEKALGTTLASLFQQTLFEELSRRSLGCEILCVANGCTDNTAECARKIFEQQTRTHLFRDSFHCRVIEVAERGKLNAWNQFVHQFSSPETRFLCLMDADIVIHRNETLWNMLAVLDQDSRANVSVDHPCKDIGLKPRKSLRDRLSLSASQSTLAAPAQLCAQLYCIRAQIARKIYLPKDLAACEDGFIKTLICTDILSHEVWPERIRAAEGAAHTFEAYTSPLAILRNQKRQILGQTIVHILVDQYLPGLPAPSEGIAESLRHKDIEDPSWLKRLIGEHLRRTRFFWRLYPGLLSLRFKRLMQLSPVKRWLCFPAAAAGTAVSFVASLLAYVALKRGCTDYWPQAVRGARQDSPPENAAPGNRRTPEKAARFARV